MIVKAFILLAGFICAAASKLLLDPSCAQSIGVSIEAWLKAGVLSGTLLVIGGLAIPGGLRNR